jgi:hypothetical protein
VLIDRFAQHPIANLGPKAGCHASDVIDDLSKHSQCVLERPRLPLPRIGDCEFDALSGRSDAVGDPVVQLSREGQTIRDGPRLGSAMCTCNVRHIVMAHPAFLS